LGDLFPPEQRGKSMAIYTLAPLLGPAVGPIAGGFITENISWRWIFYTTSIADGILQLASFLLLRETYAPKILMDKARKLRKTTGDPEYQTSAERESHGTFWGKLSVSLVRPFRLLATQPLIQFLAVYMAFLYGLMYLVLSSFPSLWTSPAYYNQSLEIGSLHYIALGIGFWGGSQICAPLNDRIYRILAARNGGLGLPEFRMPLMIISAILTPIGLVIYGWSAQERVHWIVPDIGACLIAIGIISGFVCIQTYVVDVYTKYAASALAAVTFLRCLAGFGFPLFAPYMYDKLHYGWGNSLLAFVAIGLGVPAPLSLWKFGARLRAMSTYAMG
jgi:MFS family permease